MKTLISCDMVTLLQILERQIKVVQLINQKTNPQSIIFIWQILSRWSLFSKYIQLFIVFIILLFIYWDIYYLSCSICTNISLWQNTIIYLHSTCHWTPHHCKLSIYSEWIHPNPVWHFIKSSAHVCDRVMDLQI